MSSRKSLVALVTLVVALSGCGTVHGPATPEAVVSSPTIPPFSRSEPGEPPPGWSPYVTRLKKETVYEVVRSGDQTVLRASADGSASALIHRVRFDPLQYPVLRWRWRVPALIANADNRRLGLEDSPVRVIVAFDDDTAKLSPMERVAFLQFRMLTQQTLPFATLMYIWDNDADRGSIIPNAHTSRVKMIVADTGAENVGVWREETRNIVEDFRRAFGKDPPPVKWIGVMTDADSTRSTARAYYGDIHVSAR